LEILKSGLRYFHQAQVNRIVSGVLRLKATAAFQLRGIRLWCIPLTAGIGRGSIATRKIQIS
jgi:hypothetical protein